MTKGEFQRLKVFLKTHKDKQIRFSHVYIYLHCAETDGLPQWSLDRRRIQRELGKESRALQYHSLRVDQERDVLVARPETYGNKKVKPVEFRRKDIKKLDLSFSYHAPKGSDSKFHSYRF